MAMKVTVVTLETKSIKGSCSYENNKAMKVTVVTLETMSIKGSCSYLNNNGNDGHCSYPDCQQRFSRSAFK